MSARVLGLSAGAILLGGAALAGCSSADGPAAAASQQATAAESASATAPADGAASPGGDVATRAQEPTTSSEPAGGALVGVGGRCDIGTRYTTGLVVDGAMDCGTLNDVWSQAVADPAFPHHGNRNTITVGDWTCRAHQTRPVQTGFCENNSDYTKFKVIHT